MVKQNQKTHPTPKTSTKPPHSQNDNNKTTPSPKLHQQNQEKTGCKTNLTLLDVVDCEGNKKAEEKIGPPGTSHGGLQHAWRQCS